MIDRYMEKLRGMIRKHEHKYYIEDNPEISDKEFDQLMKELIDLEKESNKIIPIDSPTQRVGGKPVLGTKVRHRNPMLSLNNSYDEYQLESFCEKIEQKFNSKLQPEKVNYTAELKIDGLGVSLIYENGIFTQGLTRGDSVYGEDITPNLQTIGSIPLRLKDDWVNYEIPSRLEARGEVYIPKDKLEEINTSRREKGENEFANPRNAAAGSLRLKDSHITASRPLDIFIYGLNFAESMEFHEHSQALGMLRLWGFRCEPHTEKCESIEEVKAFYEKWLEKRNDLPYEVDGIVVKVNDTRQQMHLGATNKAPRWATAYKFGAQQDTTCIEKIEVQVGRTGVLTPVAYVSPVNIAGATIRHATLHNEREIRLKDIRVGDYVVIERAGDVIPKIISVLKEKRTGNEKEFKFPEKCPVCESPVSKSQHEVAVRCVNARCEAQLKRKISHYVSRAALNIDGLGGRTVAQLVDSGLVNDVADLYDLDEVELRRLDRMGAKSAFNLTYRIEESKKMHPAKVLFGLGIEHVGLTVAYKLIERFETIDELMKAIIYEIEAIDGIGWRIASSIIDYFDKNKDLIERLRAAGLDCLNENIAKEMIKPKSEEIKDDDFNECTFVITGSIKGMTRTEAAQCITQRGGKISSSVSSRTDYLIAGEKPGSKYEKARGLGVSIMTAEEFLEKVR